MSLTREIVLNILSNIIEPDLQKDLVSANLVETIEIDGNKLHIEVYTSNPALHARKRIQELIEFNIKDKISSDLELTTIVKAIPANSQIARRRI